MRTKPRDSKFRNDIRSIIGPFGKKYPEMYEWTCRYNLTTEPTGSPGISRFPDDPISSGFADPLPDSRFLAMISHDLLTIRYHTIYTAPVGPVKNGKIFYRPDCKRIKLTKKVTREILIFFAPPTHKNKKSIKSWARFYYLLYQVIKYICWSKM